MHDIWTHSPTKVKIKSYFLILLFTVSLSLVLSPPAQLSSSLLDACTKIAYDTVYIATPSNVATVSNATPIERQWSNFSQYYVQ